MGIGIVLLFWGLVGLAAAEIGSRGLQVLVWDLTLGKIQGSPALARAVRMFPFICLLWAAIVWNIYAEVNETVFQRDPGIGDAWKCPLPNGYAILMVDTTDRGVVYNPRTQRGPGVSSQSDSAGASSIQLAGTMILGSATDRAFTYFLIDTTNGKRVDFPSYEDLATAAAAKGIQVRLESLEDVYYRYRFTWFDTAMRVTVLAFPLLGGILLFRSVWRVRKWEEPIVIRNSA